MITTTTTTDIPAEGTQTASQRLADWVAKAIEEGFAFRTTSIARPFDTELFTSPIQRFPCLWIDDRWTFEVEPDDSGGLDLSEKQASFYLGGAEWPEGQEAVSDDFALEVWVDKVRPLTDQWGRTFFVDLLEDGANPPGEGVLCWISSEEGQETYFSPEADWLERHFEEDFEDFLDWLVKKYPTAISCLEDASEGPSSESYKLWTTDLDHDSPILRSAVAKYLNRAR